MSIGIKCDLCGITIGATETVNVFRMWNGLRSVAIEQSGLDHIPFDENFYICDACFEKVYDTCVRLRVGGAE